MTKKKGIFKDIKKKSSPGAMNFIKPGFYELGVIKCKTGNTRNGDAYAAVDFEVLSAKRAKYQEEPSAVGSIVTWFVKEIAFFRKNIFSFLLAGCKCSENEVDANLAEAVFGPTNPLKGFQVICEASSIKTKSGHSFTKCTFYPSPLTVADQEYIKQKHEQHVESVKTLGKKKKEEKKEVLNNVYAALKSKTEKVEEKPKPKTIIRKERKILL